MGKIKIFISSILSLILASVFIYAGFIKLINPNEFFIGILNYQILPEKLIYFSAYFLPPFEILLGISLFKKSTKNTALILMIILNFIFIGAIASAWIRGLDISCGCFGSEEKTNYLNTILRDLGLILIAILILFLNKSTSHKDK